MVTPRYALDSVIRRIDEPLPDLEANQKMVIINDKGDILENLPIFFRNKLRYYVVTFGGSEGLITNSVPAMNVNYFNLNIPLVIKYEVSCPRDNEKKLVKSLWHEDNPQKSLHLLIENVVATFFETKNNISTKENIDTILSELSISINKYITKETGLQFCAWLQLEHQEKLSTHRIKNLSFLVHAKDHPFEFSVNLTADIDISDKYQAAINFPKLNLVDDKIIEALEFLCRNELTAHQLFAELKPNSVLKTKFVDAINIVLKDEGRLVNMLELTIKKDNLDIYEFKPLVISIPHTPSSSSERIEIHNELQLDLIDTGIYLAYGKPKLETWATNTLKNIFERELFEWKYVDFILRFSDFKTVITTEMETSAEKIGYKVRHIVSEPDLKENKLLRIDTYTFKYKDIPTAEPDIKVNFQVTSVFHMPSFNENIRNLLNRNQDVIKAIEENIRRVLVKALHDKDPEAVYMRFSLSENNISLQEKLQNQITECLIKDYEAIVENTIVVFLDTDIKRFYDELKSKLEVFNLEVIPKNNSRPVQLKGSIRVINPHPQGWLRLSACNFAITDIREFIKQRLEAKFNTYSGDELICTDEDHLESLEKVANIHIQLPVTEQYGLIVEIINLNSLPSGSEVEAANTVEYENMQKNRLRKKLIDTHVIITEKELEDIVELSETTSNQVKKLGQHISHLTGVDENKEELEKRVYERDKIINSSTLKQDMDDLKNKPSNSSQSSGHSKLKERIKKTSDVLLTGNKNKLLEKKTDTDDK